MLIEIFLLVIVCVLSYQINKKKIRKLFFKNNIKSCNIEEVDNAFSTFEKDKLFTPKKDTIINFFCIPPNFGVLGMTSDYEAWILSVLAKKSKRIFEFGTCSGKTTMLFAMNSSDQTLIDTITLDEALANTYKHETNDNKIAQRNLLSESKYEKFLFSETPYEKKINVIFQDSRQLDTSKLKEKFDLIFIDGGHTYSCIKNDSEKSLEMIKANGIILWHDFSIGKKSHKDVARYLNELSTRYKIKHIKNTSLCFLKT